MLFPLCCLRNWQERRPGLPPSILSPGTSLQNNFGKGLQWLWIIKGGFHLQGSVGTGTKLPLLPIRTEDPHTHIVPKSTHKEERGMLQQLIEPDKNPLNFLPMRNIWSVLVPYSWWLRGYFWNHHTNSFCCWMMWLLRPVNCPRGRPGRLKWGMWPPSLDLIFCQH